MCRVASVVINNSTREFDKEYHYSIPRELAEKVLPGIRVIVPFGKSNRSVEAYVFKVLDTTDISGLKEIKRVIDKEPILDCNMLKLAIWMKYRYICTFEDAIKVMLPPGIGVKSCKIIRLLKHENSLNTKQQKILDTLVGFGNEREYEELKGVLGFRAFSKLISELESKHLIEIFEEYSTRVREKTVRVAYLARPREEIVEEIESSRIKRIQHIRILEMLLDNEYISTADIVRFSMVSPAVLNTLKKYGYIDFKNIEIKRDPLNNREIPRTQPLNPTFQQAEVLKNIKDKLDEEKFHEVLIHGVTGSGKTEVYLQMIQYCLDKEEQAIVLVPEISLTPQMVERFKGRFGKDVAVIHSRLSIGERYDQWRLIREGGIKVVVGARSAVFAPLKRLGILIIDEEHENSYKSETTPKYHAREIARIRCSYENAILILGSATPSVETFYNAKNGKTTYLEMTERANNLMLPRVEVADMRVELEAGNRAVFSRKLTEEIINNINTAQQTILFLNRRGYASFVLCRKCGFTVKCVNCNVSMTYHSFDERLICHYCGYTIKSPELCPKCKSNYIRQFGTGTQKVEEELKKQFTNSTVIRMDMDTTTYKNSHEEILKTFREQNINVMVGTQMIAKGHDFPNVTLVGVLAADSMLNMDDFRASERTFQLLTQVAGRAGRGNIPGRVVIQTYNTEDFSILAACNHDYTSFYRQEIVIREKLGYPPFMEIATVILSGINDRNVFNTAKNVKELIKKEFSGYKEPVDILGPARAPISKIKNKYRWRIVIKYHCMETIIDVLSKVQDELYKNKGIASIDISMDINPVSML